MKWRAEIRETTVHGELVLVAKYENEIQYKVWQGIWKDLRDEDLMPPIQITIRRVR